MSDAMNLSGHVVLITGAASGLGAACVDVLGTAGARVVAADVNAEGLERIVNAVRDAGSEAHQRTLDVTDAAQAEHVVTEVAREFGRLDAIINAAGIDMTVPAEELPPDSWRRILDVNLTGPFLLARAALPLMREQGGGSIVNVTSTAAKRAWPNGSAYHASKWGLLGLSYALHAEARPYGVRVSALVPGGMSTPFLTDRFPDLDVANLQDPHDVARAVQFILCQPPGVVIPELMVLPMRETSWP